MCTFILKGAEQGGNYVGSYAYSSFAPVDGTLRVLVRGLVTAGWATPVCAVSLGRRCLGDDLTMWEVDQALRLQPHGAGTTGCSRDHAIA